MAGEATKRTFICGVGMTKFQRPGFKPDWDYPDIVKECVTNALMDANITYNDIEQAIVGYCYGESGCGQRALYGIGITGIPVYNVSNNCATGSSTLRLAKQIIESGADCVLAVGFEKVDKTSRDFKWKDRAYPIDTHLHVMDDMYGTDASPLGPQMFGKAAQEHMEKYGTTLEQFCKIAEKNHKHSVHNNLSQYQDSYTLQEIIDSKHLYGPLTKLQCCPTSDGGAAAVICSENFMNTHGLRHSSVEILALEMSTDMSNLSVQPSMIKVCGKEMVENAATKAFNKANLTPNDIDVIELHDCFSSNELMTYEYLGLCAEGEGGKIVDAGDNTYGGKYVINPSGGLLSKGHPLGATGLAQCYELCRQLRGECAQRQVQGAVIGLQQNLGLGGACIVGIYKKVDAPETPLIENDFKSDIIFMEIKNRLHADKEELMNAIKSVYCFELFDGPGDSTGIWFIDAKNSGEIYRGSRTKLKADCTIKMSDEDCFRLLSGDLSSRNAFLQGRIKVFGDLGMANKLQYLLGSRMKSKL